jgi:hypothetical protein
LEIDCIIALLDDLAISNSDLKADNRLGTTNNQLRREKMNYCKLRLVGVGIVILLVLSACSTPAVYRPEVDIFHKATTEVNSYIKAKKNAVRDVRDSLQKDMLKSKRPEIIISEDCAKAARKLLNNSPAAKEAVGCQLEVFGDDSLNQLFNPKGQFTDSVAFVEAVVVYASALDKVAKSGDKKTFLEAADGLGDAVIALAGSAAEASGEPKPDAERFTPIANLISLGAYYYLESMRTEALREAAKSADSWIKKGSMAVNDVMYSAQFEIVNASLEELRSLVDKVNEPSKANYVAEADKAIKHSRELRRQLSVDPGLPFRKLPDTHKKLLSAFEDRERNLAAAITVAKDLYNAAREAYASVVNE